MSSQASAWNKFPSLVLTTRGNTRSFAKTSGKANGAPFCHYPQVRVPEISQQIHGQPEKKKKDKMRGGEKNLYIEKMEEN